MQNNNMNDDTIEEYQTGKRGTNRRKRINRLKTAIIIIVVLLIILPIICCIILGIQVSRLQKQVNVLVQLHNEYGLSSDSDENYAYAAEKPEPSLGILKENQAGSQTAGDNASVDNKENTGENQNNEVTDLTVKDTEKENSSDSTNTDTKPDKEKSDLSKGIYAGKKVYLTFDDGPSANTSDILDILDEYHVKATFFVVGKTDEESKRLYQRIVNEGHTLGMHSYSHVYKKIYNSLEDFDKDFTKLWKLLYDTTGYKPSVYRFPGGSDNQVNKNGMEDFIQYLNDASIVYFDWNVLNGDATGVEYTKEQLIDNVLDGVAYKKNAIVLMHDTQTKKTTVDSLPGLLDKLISEGAEVLPLNKDVPPIQMIEADSIN